MMREEVSAEPSPHLGNRRLLNDEPIQVETAATPTRNEAGTYSSLVVCALPNVPDPNRIVTPADTVVS